VHIYNIENSTGEKDSMGENPPPQGYPIYWWYGDEGYKNFGPWVEEAAEKAGR
jgi:hypothetical protein